MSSLRRAGLNSGQSWDASAVSTYNCKLYAQVSRRSVAIATTRTQHQTAVAAHCFAHCVAALPSSSVYRITALLFERSTKFILVGAGSGSGLVRVRLKSGFFLAEKIHQPQRTS